MEVHGENAENFVCDRQIDLETQLLFLLTKISEMCNHLSLGAKTLETIFAAWQGAKEQGAAICPGSYLKAENVQKCENA